MREKSLRTKKEEGLYYNMFTSFKRIIKTGWKNFSRNISLSSATIFIMVMVISLATLLFIFNPISKTLISILQEKVDVSIYFKEEVSPEEILEVRSEVSKIPEVEEIGFISREQALEKFIERYKDNPVLIESLTEVGYNPFLASLNIKAHQSSQYEQVVKFLETGPFKDLIDKIDYYQRRPVIEKVFSFTAAVNKTGIFLGVILGVIAVLLAFNTIRIAIHNSGEEISIMRLVGASNWFIRGPFLVQGVVVGLIAALITLLITFGACYGFDSKVRAVAPEIGFFNIFLANFWSLLLIQLATGIGLGTVSSLIAIRKYLKI